MNWMYLVIGLCFGFPVGFLAAGQVQWKAYLSRNKHWYMDFDQNGNLTMYSREQGLPLNEATELTIKTVKKAAEIRKHTKVQAKTKPKSKLAQPINGD